VPSPRATPDVHVLAVLRAHPRLLLTPERVTELQALASSDPQCAALVAAQARRADHALTPPLPTRRLAVAEDETELAQRLIQRAYAHMPIALAAYAPAGGYQIVGAIGPVRWTWITRAHISLAADGRQAVLSENGRQLTRALHSALPATGCVVDDWLPPSVAEHQNECLPAWPNIKMRDFIGCISTCPPATRTWWSSPVRALSPVHPAQDRHWPTGPTAIDAGARSRADAGRPIRHEAI